MIPEDIRDKRKDSFFISEISSGDTSEDEYMDAYNVNDKED